jgi:hypothetical protein
MRFGVAAALCSVALLMVSCGGVVPPSQNLTETFSDTLQPRGIKFHGFTTKKSGEIEVKITALAPVTNIFLATFYGQPQNDGSCGYYQSPNEFSTLNQVSIVGQITPGPWCVGIYDYGTLAGPETYTLTVKHP